MPVIIEISKNAILRDIQEKALERGRAEGEAIAEARGRAEGKLEGMRNLVRKLLEAKFGRLPRWAGTRLDHASMAELDKWATKILTGETMTAVLGPR